MIVLFLCQLFIADIPYSEPLFEPAGPVQLPLALEHLGELRKERRGLFVPVFEVRTQEVERRLTVFRNLDVPLGHFRVEPPLGGIGGGHAAIVQTHPMRSVWSLQPGPQTGRHPPVQQTRLEARQIEPRAHE